MKWLGYTALGFLTLWILKGMTRPTLKYFSALEFGIWWPLMSKDLLLKLDLFHEQWGAPVSITNAKGGIGREDETTSQHNVLKWDEVRAVDVLPKGMIKGKP